MALPNASGAPVAAVTRLALGVYLGTCRNTLPRKSPAPPEAGGSLPPYISFFTLIPPHLYLHPILLHHSFPPSLPYPLSFAAMSLPSTTFPRVSEIFGLSLSDCLSGVTFSPNDLSQWACYHSMCWQVLLQSLDNDSVRLSRQWRPVFSAGLKMTLVLFGLKPWSVAIPSPPVRIPWVLLVLLDLPTSDEQILLFRMVFTARPSKPSLQMVWLLLLRLSWRKCKTNTPRIRFRSRTFQPPSESPSWCYWPSFIWLCCLVSQISLKVYQSPLFRSDSIFCSPPAV